MKVFDFNLYIFCFFNCLIFKLSDSREAPCALRSSPYGFVCVCNATYCDYTDPVKLLKDGEFLLTSSSKEGLRFSTKHGTFSSKKIIVEDAKHAQKHFELPDPPSLIIDNDLFTCGSSSLKGKWPLIKIDRSKKFQKVIGFGGALTGTVSHILDNLPVKLQRAIYKSFYSQKGIGFNMMRMPIGGTDFDLSPWAYNEKPENDIQLTNFKELDPRDLKKIEQINHLKKVAGLNEIKIVAAAWVSPPWMKTNNDWTSLALLKKEYYHTWAHYHLRFLELMDARNISVWGISTGNQPMNGIFGWIPIHFMTLGWTPRDQAVWLSKHFGPAIRNSKFKNIKILNNDDQRYTFQFWFKEMNDSITDSLDYIDGFAVQWYYDDSYGIYLIDETLQMYPEKMLFSTESSLGENGQGPALGSWKRAEKYARSILEDLQHSFNGFIDYNLIVNEEGGPNFVNNFVDAPVIVNTTSGTEFYKQPIFYAIGHFSKFIPEGSVRIQTEPSDSNTQIVAFERPDGTISCVFHNCANTSVTLTLADTLRGHIEINIPAKSLHTIEYK